MKKIISTWIFLILAFSTIADVSAIRIGTVDRYEAEELVLQANQGEYAIIQNDYLSGGKGIELSVNKNDDWVKNDYMRFAVPIKQRGVYRIKLGIKKGPGQGIMQLWFPDYNRRVGDKIDLFSPQEQYTEVVIENVVCNTQYTGRQFELRADGKNPQSSGSDINLDYIVLEFDKVYEANGGEFPYLNLEQPAANGDEPYVWEQVTEGGTGRSTHVVMHPTEPNLLYMGTDMGGIYRWNNDTYTWTPICDVEPFSLEKGHGADWMGIDGIALDPKNPNVIYAAVGTDSDKGSTGIGAIVKSYDRGESWQVLRETFFHSNGPQRHTNEPIIVDVGNSDIVWCATQDPSLIKSNDGGATWQEIKLPVELVKNKIFPRVVALDESTMTANGCTRVYVSVWDIGLFVTNDGGTTWEQVSDCPSAQITAMEYSGDGTMAIATHNGLFTYKNGTWNEVSPVKGVPFTEVAISKKDSNYMITSWYYGPVGSYGVYVYYTRDGGKNWTLINDDMIHNHQVPRLEFGGLLANVTDIAIDPYNEGRVFMCGWSNFYMTENIFADNVVISNYTRGIEHGCMTNLLSLPVGARLIVSSFDYGGGRYTDVTQYCDEMLPPKETNPARMSMCESNPNFIVRAGKGQIVYSTDNGINWRSFPTYPEEILKVEMGDVVVSSDVHPDTGVPAVTIIGYDNPPFVTFDLGKTWIKSQCPVNWHESSKWRRAKRLAADNKNPETLYFLAEKGLYRSDDWGLNYSLITEFDSAGSNGNQVLTSFGKNNEVFVSESGTGKLYRSSSKGELFTEIGNFTYIESFSLGKEKDSNSPATIYVYGKMNEITGIHRSVDNGETWEVIYNHATAKKKLMKTFWVCGDRQTFGLVYVGSSGRGIHYGIPADSENVFYTNKDDYIKVMINTQLEIFDVEPQLINDRTMVPMRKIFEDVGAKVSWDEKTQTVTAIRTVSDNYGIDTTTVKLTIGSNIITVNGVEKTMDIAPVIIEGRTLVPVRFISEALGAKVDWLADKRVVKITI